MNFHSELIFDLKKKDKFYEILVFQLRRIIECKKLDETFTDKFLASIHNHELCWRLNSVVQTSDFPNWLLETIQRWKQTKTNPSEAVFVCKFITIVASYEQGFQLLQTVNGLSELSSILQTEVQNENSLKPVYINFLSQVLNHPTGFEWLKSTSQWEVVKNLYLTNSNLYVEREGLNFLTKFINKAILSDSELSKTVLEEVFSLLIHYGEKVNEKNFYSVVLLLLKLLQSILKMNIYSNPYFCTKLENVFDLQNFLNFLFENCQQEFVLGEAAILQVLFYLLHCEDQKNLLTLGEIPSVLDTFCTLINKNQFGGVIKLAKYCQVLFSEMRKELNCESKTGVHCIIVQLLPALICIKPIDTAVCDIYIQKLFSLTPANIQKFCYFLRNELRNKVEPKPKNLALKGILSVITQTECLNLEEAVIIFQAMAYLLKSFIPDFCCSSEPFNYYKSSNENSLCLQDSQLLSAVLNALCIFIEKFKINWTESLESLALLKMTCVLLESSDLPSVIVVQVFLLVKLAILNFMSPDLALLLNNTKDSCFDFLMPLLYKRLHDPNWEIRDSCLEVVTAIAELSQSKYPAFQQLLVEKDLYSFVIDIMEGDSESYVRASAIQALTVMTKIETLHQFLIKAGFQYKIINLIQNESEGIVRREAALAIKQIFLSLNNPHDEILTSFYEIMGYLAVCDLHWEVKVNALGFWETVIQHILADQGMIDGSFPKVTFSKEHKKIVNLNEEEIKLRLDKVLGKLSKIGCLYVLLSTLNDDCDMPVINKSAQILSDLLKILERYGVTGSSQGLAKRKMTDLDNCEKRMMLTSVASSSNSSSNQESVHKTAADFEESTSSDKIIEGIVNEKDINLLVGVYSQKGKSLNIEKKILLQEVKPDTFLLQMKDFSLEKFLEDKQKWLIDKEVDLKLLVNETNKMNLNDETNVMDCY